MLNYSKYMPCNELLYEIVSFCRQDTMNRRLIIQNFKFWVEEGIKFFDIQDGGTNFY